jgi:hypothetical protein
MKLSVIIPTFNRSACVGEAIRSALEQTRPPDEVIVVDDGSTDETADVLSAFGSAVRVIRQANAGVSAARNAGIGAARGEWLAFLDSDDLWMPEKLERQLKSASAYPGVVAQMVDAVVEGYGDDDISMFAVRGYSQTFERRPFRPRPLRDVLEVQFFTSTWLLRRETVVTCGMFPSEISIYEDLALLSKVAARGPFSVDCYGGTRMRRVKDVAGALSDQQISTRAHSISNLCQIYSELLSVPRLAPDEIREVRRRLGGARFELAETLATAGSAPEARRQRWQSVRDDPRFASAARAALGQIRCASLWRSLSAIGHRKRLGFRRSSLDASIRKRSAHP